MNTGNAASRLGLTESEQEHLLAAASGCVVAAATRAGGTPEQVLGELGHRIVHGVYVSLKREGRLRGCCGSTGRPVPLAVALADAARRSTLEDPRFPKVSPTELPYLDIEVWLLGPSEPLEGDSSARLREVQVGRHGLRIRLGERSGLLLPGVPVEFDWDASEFLEQLCAKAGLPAGSWRDPSAELMRFEGVCFTRPAPGEAGPSAATPPLFTADQVHAYVGFAGQMLGDMTAGMATVTYFPQVPDADVNGVALVLRVPERNLTWNASRVQIQNSIPFQSTLRSLCEDLAAVLKRNMVSGQVTLDLVILTDPTFHGTVGRPDLRGFTPADRCLLVTERGRSGWKFDPQSDPTALLREVAEAVEVADPDEAAVLSLGVLSTVQPVGIAAVPRPTRGPEERQPAVAGRFYPSDAGEIDGMLDALFAEPAPKRTYGAVMVPHAGWGFSGRVAAEVFKRVEFPKRVIVMSPKHTPDGVEWAVAPQRTWRLPGRDLASDLILARRLCEAIPGLKLDAAAHAREHGIEVELPMIARLAPEAKVVGVTVGGGTLEQCRKFAAGLAEVMAQSDEPPLLVISSDMNHFADDETTRRLDELALAELDRLDAAGLFEVTRRNHISMCGVRPAVIVLEALRTLGRLTSAERIAYATSGEVSGDRSRVVGYAGMAFA